jgi:hypothetical protein
MLAPEHAPWAWLILGLALGGAEMSRRVFSCSGSAWRRWP